MPKLSLHVIDNGPLKVSNLKSARFAGELLEVGDEIFLCRCGQTKNAPFCDGTHKTVGFSGARESAGDREVVVWEGRSLRTFYNPNVCMHVFYCKPLKELRARELEGDAEAGPEIIRVVHTCPSGALTYEAKAAIPEPAPPAASADVEVMEGGEVRVRCEFEVNAPLRERQPADRATLCRCGLSKSKPWCDGRHRQRTDFR